MGPAQVRVNAGWQSLADKLGFEVDPDDDAPSGRAFIVVGSPAFVLGHAGRTTDPFGLVMPIAQSARPWQRAPSWRDDGTLALWRAGWTLLNVDRVVLVAGNEATIEFVIADARRTPPVERADA